MNFWTNFMYIGSRKQQQQQRLRLMCMDKQQTIQNVRSRQHLHALCYLYTKYIRLEKNKNEECEKEMLLKWKREEKQKRNEKQHTAVRGIISDMLLQLPSLSYGAAPTADVSFNSELHLLSFFVFCLFFLFIYFNFFVLIVSYSVLLTKRNAPIFGNKIIHNSMLVLVEIVKEKTNIYRISIVWNIQLKNNVLSVICWRNRLFEI